MNAAPVLWKAVQNLQGSRTSTKSCCYGCSADVTAATLYAMTKKLARVLSVPLTLHRSLAPELVRINKKDPTFHKLDSAIPEVALVAVVIVVIKMVYGLDGKPRYGWLHLSGVLALGPLKLTKEHILQHRQPRDKCDPACALPLLSELLSAIRNADAFDLKHTPAYSLDTSL